MKLFCLTAMMVVGVAYAGSVSAFDGPGGCPTWRCGINGTSLDGMKATESVDQAEASDSTKQEQPKTKVEAALPLDKAQVKLVSSR